MPPLACAGPGRTCHRPWPEDAGRHGDAGSAIQAAMPTAFLPITAGRQISVAIEWLAVHATNHAAPVRRRDPMIVLGTTRCSAAVAPGWSGPGHRQSRAGARQKGEDFADGGLLAGGFGQREVRLDLVAVAAAVFLLHHP